MTKTLSGYGSCVGAPVPFPTTLILTSPVRFFEVAEDFWGCDTVAELVGRYLSAVPLRRMGLEELRSHLGPPNGSPEVLREGEGGVE